MMNPSVVLARFRVAVREGSHDGVPALAHVHVQAMCLHHEFILCLQEDAAADEVIAHLVVQRHDPVQEYQLCRRCSHWSAVSPGRMIVGWYVDALAGEEQTV